MNWIKKVGQILGYDTNTTIFWHAYALEVNHLPLVNHLLHGLITFLRLNTHIWTLHNSKVNYLHHGLITFSWLKHFSCMLVLLVPCLDKPLPCMVALSVSCLGEPLILMHVYLVSPMIRQTPFFFYVCLVSLMLRQTLLHTCLPC